ncbi:MAG TPA: alkaline phosphatase D family protein, partial [Steroidobacteraceae bacterium]|nr:alkaline phosphatase D family protein [Steroidobacteraceae bacterium]
MKRGISRREFNRLAAAAGASALIPFADAAAQVRFASPPFQLGVASGDPAPDGFVIWTRLAPEPMDTAYLGQTIFEVAWEVAEDSAFSTLVKQGTAWARPHLAHSLHVEVAGLQAGREYFYRFRLGRYESATGRALTCPAGDKSPERLRFAFASCAHYEQGYFSAYRHMAADRPDLILMLGDYIYEDAWGERRVRQFDTLEAVTLEDYRHRYTQYRTDPDLRAAHAACPWLVTWDDHEVDNDYVGLTSEHELCGGKPVREAFPARRAAAYQAWYEHMPVRPSRLNPAMAVRIYGATGWGRLARFYVLDTRQY